MSGVVVSRGLAAGIGAVGLGLATVSGWASWLILNNGLTVLEGFALVLCGVLLLVGLVITVIAAVLFLDAP